MFLLFKVGHISEIEAKIMFRPTFVLVFVSALYFFRPFLLFLSNEFCCIGLVHFSSFVSLFFLVL